jgi:hypothetical protein
MSAQAASVVILATCLMVRPVQAIASVSLAYAPIMYAAPVHPTPNALIAIPARMILARMASVSMKATRITAILVLLTVSAM